MVQWGELGAEFGVQNEEKVPEVGEVEVLSSLVVCKDVPFLAYFLSEKVLFCETRQQVRKMNFRETKWK